MVILPTVMHLTTLREMRSASLDAVCKLDFFKFRAHLSLKALVWPMKKRHFQRHLMDP